MRPWTNTGGGDFLIGDITKTLQAARLFLVISCMYVNVTNVYRLMSTQTIARNARVMPTWIFAREATLKHM